MTYLATLIFLLFTVTLQASIAPVDVLVSADPTSETVIIRSATAVSHATTMSVFTQRGEQVYTADIAAGAYVSKRFPAAVLPAALYVLHFTDALGRTTLPFKIDESSTVQYSFAEGTHTLFPRVNMQEARTLVLSYPATEQCKAYRMTLQDAQGQTVFTDEVASTTSVRKAIQLEALHAGTYTIAFAADNRKLNSTAITLR